VLLVPTIQRSNNNDDNTMKPLWKFVRRKSKTAQAPSSSVKDNLNDDATAVKPQQQKQPKKESGSVVALILGSGSYCHDTGILSMALKTLASSASATNKNKAAQRFLRNSSSFLRVADLGLDTPDDNSSVGSADCTVMSSATSNSVANFSYAASDPPPGVDHDPEERWIALDDGTGSHAPIAPLAVQALAKTGLDASLDEGMWAPHTSSRYFKAAPWHVYTWPSSGVASIPQEELPEPNAKYEDMVFLWTGKFQHGCYGSELPAVRAVGIIPAPPQALFDLLVDSTRVKEYNKMSLGREDLLILQDNLHEDGPFGKSVTKVMRSTSSPPLVSKTMELVSMLHAQELEDGSGYLIVTRAVSHPENHLSDASVLRSEILLGVNVIRRIAGDPHRCIMINMIHMRSPMVPMIIANRIGASAASGFIKDLQKAGKEL